jgi:hypothetical protein
VFILLFGKVFQLFEREETFWENVLASFEKQKSEIINEGSFRLRNLWDDFFATFFFTKESRESQDVQ